MKRDIIGFQHFQIHAFWNTFLSKLLLTVHSVSSKVKVRFTQRPATKAQIGKKWY